MHTLKCNVNTHFCQNSHSVHIVACLSSLLITLTSHQRHTKKCFLNKPEATQSRQLSLMDKQLLKSCSSFFSLCSCSFIHNFHYKLFFVFVFSPHQKSGLFRERKRNETTPAMCEHTLLTGAPTDHPRAKRRACFISFDIVTLVQRNWIETMIRTRRNVLHHWTECSYLIGEEQRPSNLTVTCLRTWLLNIIATPRSSLVYCSLWNHILPILVAILNASYG